MSWFRRAESKHTFIPVKQDQVRPDADRSGGGDCEGFGDGKESEVPSDVNASDIIVGTAEETYSPAQKMAFLSGWSNDLSVIAREILNLSSERIVNTIRDEDASLAVEWDEQGNVRPIWIKTTGEGSTLIREEVDDITQIVEAFPLPVLETLFYRAQDALEYQRKRDALRKGGPQPPVDLSGAK